MIRRALALGAALAWLAAPAPAHAGPCCMSSAAIGSGRLLPWERFAVGLSTRALYAVGYWDAEGVFRPSSASYSETELRAEASGMVAVVPTLTLSLAVPAVATFRSAGETDDLGGGLGDVRAGVRWDLVPVGGHAWLPGAALTASVTAPTGRSMDETRSILGADATGRGAWILGAGFSLERVQMPWFVRLDLGATLPLPARRDDLGVDQRFGAGVGGALSGGLELSPGVVTSLWWRLAWEDDLTLAGQRARGTQHMDLGIGAALSWRFGRWAAQAGVDSGVFVDGAGRNQPGRAGASLFGRYGR